ncbi:MAG: zinc ribbon domain-containing protein [Chloroflexia bacterium]|nr:zinc ribbon domain-containing protein [Chloroflexia bacterium]
MTNSADRFCPICGADNATNARFCGECGRALPSRDEVLSIWARPPAPNTHAQSGSSIPAGPKGVPLEVAAGGERGLGKHRGRGTTVPPASRFSLAGRSTPAPPMVPTNGEGGSAPHTTAWLNRPGQPPLLDAPLPPEPTPPRRGPHGCLLGGLATLLILGVTLFVLWSLVVRPYLGNVAREQIRDGAIAQIERIDRLPVLPSGEIVVREAEINDRLATDPSAYEPITEPRVEITPERIAIRFSLYGTSSTYAGQLDVEEGNIVVRNGTVDGPAGQVLSPEDVAVIVEEQLAALLSRSDLTATAVRTEGDSLRITTSKVRGGR